MLKKKIKPKYSVFTFQKFWFRIAEFSEVYVGVAINVYVYSVRFGWSWSSK